MVPIIFIVDILVVAATQNFIINHIPALAINFLKTDTLACVVNFNQVVFETIISPNTSTTTTSSTAIITATKMEILFKTFVISLEAYHTKLEKTEMTIKEFYNFLFAKMKRYLRNSNLEDY